MIALWIVLGLLALPLILLLIPIRLSLDFQNRTMKLRIGHGLIRIQLLPKRKKKKSKPAAKTEAPEPTPKPQPKRDISDVYEQAQQFIPLAKKMLAAIPNIFGAVCIDRLTVHVRFFQEDPADLALHYGQAWAASGWIVAALSNLFTIKRQDVRPVIDDRVDGFDLQASIRVRVFGWKIAALAMRLAKQYLCLRWQMRKNRKGESL